MFNVQNLQCLVVESTQHGYPSFDPVFLISVCWKFDREYKVSRMSSGWQRSCKEQKNIKIETSYSFRTTYRKNMYIFTYLFIQAFVDPAIVLFMFMLSFIFVIVVLCLFEWKRLWKVFYRFFFFYISVLPLEI